MPYVCTVQILQIKGVPELLSVLERLSVSEPAHKQALLQVMTQQPPPEPHPAPCCTFQAAMQAGIGSFQVEWFQT